jgi:putative flippase GtrA
VCATAKGSDSTARGQALRFIAFGGLNTVVTYALYCAIVTFISPQVAYAIVFLLGIGLAFVLNSRFVFGTRLHLGSAAIYPLVYVVQYGANALLIDAFIALGCGPRTALAVSLVIVTPLSFALNRAVLTRRSGHIR